MTSLADFKNQKDSLPSVFSNQSQEMASNYRKRLEASVKCVKYLLLQGLSFRGHLENSDSLNQGNFLELLKFHAKDRLDVEKVVLENAPGNCQMTAPCIQKDIIHACAKETTKVMLDEIGHDFFAILADESADISDKEQMALCLRYIDRNGGLNERFLSLVHVPNTTSLTLKEAIESLLMEHSLSLSRVRGQGYDGASNMRGEIAGLKTLITDECPQAYYVHCLSHQLQLTLVAVAKKNSDCSWLFLDVLPLLLNFVGGSPKRKEFLRQNQRTRVVEALSSGEIESGTGLNQEKSLSRPGDTRWGSHYKTIVNVLDLYRPILESLDAIAESSIEKADKNKACAIINLLMTFDFVFVAYLMTSIFGITHELNLALQKSDQDIVNAMTLVDVTKRNLQKLRDGGWDTHMTKVSSFLTKHDIEILNMEGMYVAPGRRMFRGNTSQVTNLHHFRVEVFLSVIDQQLQEIENRFSEKSKELLICMSCFNPSNRFASYDKEKLLRLAEFYPNEFSSVEMFFFEHSLDNFIEDVRNDERFWNVKTLNELSIKLVETKKHETHSKVYLLLKLVLILPVATASVERAFSTMTMIKNKLRNSMGDGLLNDCLVTFLEKDLFCDVEVDAIVNRFQNLRTRREQL
ncbi:uncharacterized protein LOC104891545 [Beta vulgaris subsp. vulgaris]|uniref:uncharacterized protein LOC104891545 n=1 Tax=Beta vulgaris subsp. vulgaris TaxID=3555 RepID=UPI0020372FA7|nr:uncharacterized protein LOC104891545 [Beta vulgaris subsp. vulgaris]